MKSYPFASTWSFILTCILQLIEYSARIKWWKKMVEEHFDWLSDYRVGEQSARSGIAPYNFSVRWGSRKRSKGQVARKRRKDRMHPPPAPPPAGDRRGSGARRKDKSEKYSASITARHLRFELYQSISSTRSFFADFLFTSRFAFNLCHISQFLFNFLDGRQAALQIFWKPGDNFSFPVRNTDGFSKIS